STDNTLGGVTPSDALYPTQKATKAYIDSHGGATSGAVYTAFSNQTTGIYTHNLGTDSHIVQCRDANSVVINPKRVTTGVTADTITFEIAQTGICTFVSGSGQQGPQGDPGPAGGSGKVNVVTFGATPTFNLSSGNIQKITLAGDVISMTLSNPVSGS